MATYRFSASDADQVEISGQTVADDPGAARRQLEATGLRVTSLAPAEGATDQASALFSAHALDLTAQIAALTSAGLPLAAGLSAMQAELPPGKLSQTIGQIVKQLEAGLPLEAVLERYAHRLPAYMRGLMAVGSRSGRLPELLEECVMYEQRTAEIYRRVRGVLAYPVIMLWLLSAWMLFGLWIIAPPILQIIQEFDIQVDSDSLLFWIASEGRIAVTVILVSVLIAPLVVRVFFDARLMNWVFMRIPLVGPIWRSAHLAASCSLWATLLEESIPLPATLRMSAAGVPDRELQAACGAAAARVEAGQSLSQSIKGLRAFPRVLQPILAWGENLSALPEALRSAAELNRNRADAQAQLLEAVVPPLMFLIITAAALEVLFGFLKPVVGQLRPFLWWGL